MPLLTWLLKSLDKTADCCARVALRQQSACYVQGFVFDLIWWKDNLASKYLARAWVTRRFWRYCAGCMQLARSWVTCPARSLRGLWALARQRRFCDRRGAFCMCWRALGLRAVRKHLACSWVTCPASALGFGAAILATPVAALHAPGTVVGYVPLVSRWRALELRADLFCIGLSTSREEEDDGELVFFQ